MHLMVAAELVKRVVEAYGWRAEGELGEGVMRLMGGGVRQRCTLGPSLKSPSSSSAPFAPHTPASCPALPAHACLALSVKRRTDQHPEFGTRCG